MSSESTTAGTSSKSSSISDVNKATRLDLLGVSVHWLSTGFLDEVRQQRHGNDNTALEEDIDPLSLCIHDLEDLKDPLNYGIARSKGPHVLSPVDHRKGASYVHCLEGDDNVGMATFMLSYTWTYSISSIVEAIQQHCTREKLDPKRTYIWMDVLSINQHRVMEAKLNGGTGLMNFEQVFPDQLQTIGHMLALMSPWGNPTYLSRIWCVFEIYTAYDCDCDCDVTIIMPPSEKQSLETAILGADNNHNVKIHNPLNHALNNINIETAQATFAADRTMILNMIQHSVGYEVLNREVSEYLREWMKTVIHGLVVESNEAIEKKRQDQDEEVTIDDARNMTQLVASFINTAIQ